MAQAQVEFAEPLVAQESEKPKMAQTDLQIVDPLVTQASEKPKTAQAHLEIADPPVTKESGKPKFAQPNVDMSDPLVAQANRRPAGASVAPSSNFDGLRMTHKKTYYANDRKRNCTAVSLGFVNEHEIRTLNKPKAKPNLYLPEDIDGLRPRTIHPLISGHRPRDMSLNTKDIEHASPSCHGFITRRHLDPLDPQYQLPSFTERPFTPLKFIRDHIDVSDITKAPAVPPRKCIKNPADGADIDGSTPNRLRVTSQFPTSIIGHPKSTNYTLETKDINEPPFPRAKFRETSPLEPSYVLPSWGTHTYQWSEEFSNQPVTSPRRKKQFSLPKHRGELALTYLTHIKPHIQPKTDRPLNDFTHDTSAVVIIGSENFKNNRPIRSTPSSNLTTSDIPGAIPGWLPNRYFSANRRQSADYPEERFQTKDIQGAQADTKRQGIRTPRVVNPLMPQYAWGPPAERIKNAAVTARNRDNDIPAGLRYLRDDSNKEMNSIFNYYPYPTSTPPHVHVIPAPSTNNSATKPATTMANSNENPSEKSQPIKAAGCGTVNSLSKATYDISPQENFSIRYNTKKPQCSPRKK